MFGDQRSIVGHLLPRKVAGRGGSDAASWAPPFFRTPVRSCCSGKKDKRKKQNSRTQRPCEQQTWYYHLSKNNYVPFLFGCCRDKIYIHGQCLIAETVVMEAGRAYEGDSRTGTILKQANHSQLAAVVATAAFVNNYTWTDNPLSIAHLTIDGNIAGNPRPTTTGARAAATGTGAAAAAAAAGATTCLAIRAWFYTADDLKIQNCGGDGILVGTATPRDGAGPNSRISNSWVSSVGGEFEASERCRRCVPSPPPTPPPSPFPPHPLGLYCSTPFCSFSCFRAYCLRAFCGNTLVQATASTSMAPRPTQTC